jgi:hypothetical protein
MVHQYIGNRGRIRYHINAFYKKTRPNDSGGLFATLKELQSVPRDGTGAPQ